MRYVVIGAGRQGVAAAYDLALHGGATQVVLVDRDSGALARGIDRLNTLLGRGVASGVPLDVQQDSSARLGTVLHGAAAAISAVPFHHNLALTRAAIAAGVHFCDFGGNTDVVWQQLSLNEAARQAGVAVVPDCGQVPGLGTSLAVYAMSQFDPPEEVVYWDGGLDEEPEGPFGYHLRFHIEGLLNEYEGEAVFLRDGAIVRVPALSEPEIIEIDGLGRFEAFVTSGGTSTAPWSFQGRLQRFENKTLRYPGHFQAIRFLADAGFLSRTSLPGLSGVTPRQVTAEVLDQAFRPQGSHRDLVIIHLRVTGRRAGRQEQLRLTLVDRFDPSTHFTAMERTTGWHGAMVAAMMAKGLIPPGARPVELAVPADRVVEGCRRRGMVIESQWVTL